MRRAVLLLTTLVALGALITYRLDRYPAPWYDEGVNLQAARNFAERGLYGLEYDGRVQPFDPQMTTGPTVIGPVAAVFRVFGEGVLQARAVMAAYALLAALGLFWVAAELFGYWVGVLAMATMASIGDYVGLTEARSVLGEIAALAFLFLAAAVLAHAWTRPSGQALVWAALAGLLFGFAILTKAQFAVIIPVLLGLFVWARRRGSSLATHQLVLLLAALALPLLTWQVLQLVVLGPRGYVDNLAVVQSLAQVSSEAPPLRKTGSSLGDVQSTMSAWPGLAALAYIWVRLARGDPRLARPEALLLPAFATVSWIWFVCFSMGWLRLAVPAITSGSLCLAVATNDLLRGARSLRGSVAAQVVVAALVLSPIAIGIGRNAAVLARADDVAAYELAALVNQRVEAHATIETDEWELDLLLQRSSHHPPATVVANAVGAVELEAPATLVQSYEVAAGATYLIDGRFSKLDGIYRHALGEGRFAWIASLGDYDLYERVDGG
jgi:hypothetical protein